MSLFSPEAQHRTNSLLSALNKEDFAHLEPHLELTELRNGMVVYETDDTMPFFYFPHNAVVSLTNVLPDGKTVDVAVLGKEAMFGLASAFVSRRSIGRFVVQTAGTVSRINTDVLHRAFEERQPLREIFLSYEGTVLTEALQTMACHAVHSVEARCCRWILTILDRTGHATLPLTHESLSRMLGVQRSTISLVTSALQSAKMIRQSRGAITVLDRSGLEHFVCDCYKLKRQRSKQTFFEKNSEIACVLGG